MKNKTLSILSIIIIVMAVLSMIQGFALIAIINHMMPVNAYVACFIEHSYLMFIFIIVPVVSIVFGLITHKKGFAYNKNIVVGILTTLIIIISGCLCIFSYKISHEASYETEMTVMYHLPKNGKEVAGPINNDKVKVARIRFEESRDLAMAEVEAKITNAFSDEIDYKSYKTLSKYRFLFIGYDRFIIFENGDWIIGGYEKEGYDYCLVGWDFERHQVIVIWFIGR